MSNRARRTAVVAENPPAKQKNPSLVGGIVMREYMKAIVARLTDEPNITHETVVSRIISAHEALPPEQRFTPKRSTVEQSFNGVRKLLSVQKNLDALSGKVGRKIEALPRLTGTRTTNTAQEKQSDFDNTLAELFAESPTPQPK